MKGLMQIDTWDSDTSVLSAGVAGGKIAIMLIVDAVEEQAEHTSTCSVSCSWPVGCDPEKRKIHLENKNKKR